MAENIVRTLFTTKVIKSHVKLHMKSDTAKIPRESTPYITLKLHFSQHDREFSACCNTSCGIKLAASQADRLRSACSLAIKFRGKANNLSSTKLKPIYKFNVM